MGDSDVASSLYNGAGDVWRARVGAIYGTSGADQLYHGSQELDKNGHQFNQRDMIMTMQMASLTAGVDAPWGTGVSLLLPYASLHYTDWLTTPTHPAISSNAIGDAELRVRQDVLQPFALKPLSGAFKLPRIYATVGVVLPNTTAYSTDAIQNLSISRGSWWLIQELEAHFQLPANFGASLIGGMREALNYANAGTPDPNGVGWGNEYRAALAVHYILDLPTVEGAGNYFIPKRLIFLANGEYLYRSQSTVVEGDTPRALFEDSGSQTVSVTPTLLIGYNDDWSVTASARVPAYRFVNGTQPVQYTSFFFGLNWSWSSAPTARIPPSGPKLGSPPSTAEINKLLVPGKYTLIDYWATWCEPCGRLGVKLEHEVPQRPGVALARVDATTWEADDWSRFLPGVPGIPVLDIFDRQGKLLVRLQGDDCFGYAQHLPADASEATAP